jgi:glycosyltransferase involved in cell wall biosynthesis
MPCIITIGLPFYNNEKTLEKAINSVLMQTYSNWELLLIDDGSIDGSKSLALKAARSEKRIRYLSDGVNRGLVYRLNQITNMAKGQYIARMDADDMMLPEKLEKQLIVFQHHPEIDIVATAAYTIDEYDTPIGIRDTKNIELIHKKEILKNALLIHPTILVKTAWYKANKYDKDFLRAEDYELWCRSFEHTKFYRITEPLFLYREGNVTLRNYNLSMQTLRKIFKKYGRGVLTHRELSFEILKTHIKSFMYSFFSFFGVQYLLSARRNVLLTPQQKQLIDADILKIKNYQTH